MNMNTPDLLSHAVTGCDGSFCDDPEHQKAFPLEDMPQIAFCSVCLSREQQRQRTAGKAHTPDKRGQDFHFEKIRRTRQFVEE
jgi:hypothetical protein